MRKGFVNMLEVMLVATILILAFMHFFPQYKIQTEWHNKLLEVELRDTLITIDRLDKTYEFAIEDPNKPEEFDNFMNAIYSLDHRGTVYVWWMRTDCPGNMPPGVTCISEPVPYYTRGSEKSIVETFYSGGQFYNYTFSIGLGTPY